MEGHMITSNKKMTLLSDVEKVWSVVTDLKDCAWRSDLSRIEILEDGKRFIEYTKDGYPTTFTITVKEPVSYTHLMRRLIFLL